MGTDAHTDTIKVSGVSLMLLMVICFSAGTVHRVHACSCLPPSPPLEALEKTDYVFSGVVRDIVKPENPSDRYGNTWEKTSVTFTVYSVWKGEPKETLTVTTPSQGSLCGFGFAKGKEYIVYAGEKDGKLSTNNCSRTRRLERARQDREELGEGTIINTEDLGGGTTIRGDIPDKTDGIAVPAAISVLIITLLITSISIARKKKSSK